eukprot:1158397-Pelagomonas_calceolata.AAC.5
MLCLERHGTKPCKAGKDAEQAEPQRHDLSAPGRMQSLLFAANNMVHPSEAKVWQRQQANRQNTAPANNTD